MSNWIFDVVLTDGLGKETPLSGQCAGTQSEADAVMDNLVELVERLGLTVAGGYREVRNGQASEP